MRAWVRFSPPRCEKTRMACGAAARELTATQFSYSAQMARVSVAEHRVAYEPFSLPARDSEHQNTLSVAFAQSGYLGGVTCASGAEMPIPDDSVRAELADFLVLHEPQVTQQWLELVHAAADIDHARKLPRQTLLDHLPQLYAELCEWVRVGQRNHLTREAKHDAKLHGTERWKVGFRLDEVIRELDILRAIILSSTLSRFRERSDAFNPEVEIDSRFTIEEYFSRVGCWSIRQYVAEHEATVAQHLTQLEHTNRELELAASQRQRLTSVLTHELRNFVERLFAVIHQWEREPTSASVLALVKNQVEDLSNLLQQLVQHSSTVGGRQPLSIESFDPRQLCEELVLSYSAAAQAKQLALQADFTTAPASVTSDRLIIKQIASNLLSNSIRCAHSGQVHLIVEQLDPIRWRLQVLDTGPGLAQTDANQLLEGLGTAQDPLPGRGIGLGITKDLVDLLQGSIEWHSQPGEGTRCAVTLPRHI